MRLIDAKRMIDRDEILLVDKTKLHEEPYAILSHTWGRQDLVWKPDGTQVRGAWGHDDDEILFADIGEDDTKQLKPDAWKKILKACEVAQDQKCDYLWVDTCCINQQNPAEVVDSINAMFYWYQQSKVCLAYLADLEAESVRGQGEEELKACRWFGRGWTLQELIAPKKVEFYNENWKNIGSRTMLSDILSQITGINWRVLTGDKSYLSFTVAERMKWAAQRKTTRPEDRAYSLLGLFDVHMSKLYGVGGGKGIPGTTDEDHSLHDGHDRIRLEPQQEPRQKS
ncbi:hypothetical protein PFICI_06757 [Pestalotiopsis fici W106-1]|uniref:Heterokaryon incompatibility domain-containing protein n=1 Tax=Pestalotiopsis fici (strain W106-1 / CGMCC3.15140) TaxID=1229662 RepID=W3X6T4_PESFW|nr:uncharacterized protein PFICI_06757 [Pestalotiopsis fici W106-1]ETS81755.1 hypothetical protein PFICI_06757 [Pestalotiopsis fici W106-1]